MSVNSAVEELYCKGLSYNTLAIVTGINVRDVKEARKEPAILSLESRRRCQRLDDLLTEAMTCNPTVDPVAIFEEHILLGKVDDKLKWAYISELWVNGSVTDEYLFDLMVNIKDLYSYIDLREHHPMEYEVVEGGDGYPAILAKLPISRAEGDELKRLTI